ncbi:MAG: class I SAM-dependent methyltransferase [Actinomycetota bacterium]|nr:class I SAM-dependent methyltransferase [Actinomycetota bacterium]
MEKIVLTEEKETLLVPLFGKAMENKKRAPVLIDKKAVEIVNQINYNFKSLKIPEKTNIMMCLRAKLIDNLVKDFLSKSNEVVALHLGCGLDSRYDRVANYNTDWYDVDFKEVIDIRKYFYKETDNYHMLSSSVTEQEWLDKIPEGKKKYIVIAEGLFMYLKEENIKELINNLKIRIGSYTLIFDVYSVFTARNIKNHPSLKKTGVKVNWGIDTPEELIKWGLGIQLIEEKYFTSNEEIKNLDIGTRIIFKIANVFPIAKKAQRLLICRVD